MKCTYEQAVSLIFSSLEELNEQLPEADRLPSLEDTPLRGSRSGLDSLNLINLMTSIEDRIESEFRVYVSTAEEESDGESDPWATVKTLAHYVQSRINQEA